MKFKIFVLFAYTALSAHISYNDIINQSYILSDPYINTSRLSDIFSQKLDRSAKIAYLYSLGTRQADSSVVITLTNVPTIGRARLKNLSLRIAKGTDGTQEDPDDMPGSHEVYAITIFDPARPSFVLLKGMWYIHNDEGDLNAIRLGEESPAAAAAPGPQEVSGSTLMKLWDGLCWLCKVGAIKLADVSLLPEDDDHEIELSILYPYLWGSTFYERFGYVAQRGTAQELAKYEQAKHFLTNRPALEILNDFKDIPEVYDALLKGYAELQLFLGQNKPLSQAIMGDFIRIPLVRIKTISKRGVDASTGRTQRYYLDRLKTIYENCIENYLSSNDEKNRFIESKQMILLQDSQFEKRYS